MPVWKVLVIFALACVTLALLSATVVVPLNFDGNERWLWMGGLAVATIAVIVLFAFFLRYAGASLDAKPGSLRR